MVLKKPRPARAGSLRDRLITVGVIGFAALVILAAGSVGLRQLWRTVAGREEFQVRPSEVEISSAWVRLQEMRKDFVSTAPETLGRRWSIFEPNLATQVALAYARSPWVRRVRGVSRVFPNRLDIRLDLREPYAVVMNEDGTCWVLDEDGVLLNPAVYDLSPARIAALTPVVAPKTRLSRPTAWGRPWDDPIVQGGLAMVKLCRTKFAGKVGISRVEVATAGGSDLATADLVLDTGPRVSWGRVPGGAESAAEVTTPQKAAALLAVVKKEGKNIGRLKTLDVRWTPTRYSQ